jgi:hypothetical protein
MTTLAEPAVPTGGLAVLGTGQTVGSTNRATVVWGPTNGAYTVDYPTTLLGDFTVDPTFDTGTHILGWTAAAGAKTPQFSLGELFASRGSLGFDWTIVGPSGTQIQFPTLPTDTADFTIVATDVVTVETAAIAYVPGGYDSYRAKAFLGPPGPVGASGNAGYNLWQPAPTFAARHRAWPKHRPI